MTSVEGFKNRVLATILDKDGTHHQFGSGLHGQKLDFDLIDKKDPLYEEWIDITESFIRQKYTVLPEVIIGVANGANRIALDTAPRFGGQVFGAVSEKAEPPSRVIRLAKLTSRLITAMRPALAIVVEDVSTTGANSVQVAQQVKSAGARNVEVVTTWQRSPRLERLHELGIVYRTIIHENLPTYQPEECQENGFCANNWELIQP
jgi:hypothetical protein